MTAPSSIDRTFSVTDKPAAAIEIAADDPEWPRRFPELGSRLRGTLGETARRIDHVGHDADTRRRGAIDALLAAAGTGDAAPTA